MCPKLERWLSRAQDQRGSPCVIIICSSAVRALELRQSVVTHGCCLLNSVIKIIVLFLHYRNISELCTIGTVAKLFAKHMKVAINYKFN